MEVVSHPASEGRLQTSAADRAGYASAVLLAHEIRTPLMIIRASLNTLRRSATVEGAHQAIAEIDGEVSCLTRIVTELLELHGARRTEVVDLGALCTEAIRRVAVGTRRPILCIIEPDLPPLVANADRLRMALENLLSNACEAVEAAEALRHEGRGSADGREVPIELRIARVRRDTLSVRVRDSGVGVPRRLLARVFEPRFTTKPNGLGLGLALVRQVVEEHGGRVTLRNRASGGAEVRLDLPYHMLSRDRGAPGLV